MSRVIYKPYALYKRNKNGSIQQWQIEVREVREAELYGASGEYGSGAVAAGEIIVSFGQVGGQIQVTKDLVTRGKNEGRSNATTALQQAEAEACSRWQKQVKKGYTTDLDKAQKGEDEIGGYLPMLAHSYADHGKKIQFPAMTQPKLDGIRCVAEITGDGVRLFSRTRKPITSMKHIENELFEIWKLIGTDMVLDGELYNHELKHDFEQIVSAVRREDYDPAVSQKVQYHIYDMISDEDAMARQLTLDSIFRDLPFSHDYLRRVDTRMVSSAREVTEHHDKYVAEGYEGAMVRSPAAKYQNSRSYDLQKVKVMRDEEFEIIGVKEGRGKMAGKGIFICTIEDRSETFDCKLEGPLENLEKVWQNRDSYAGRKLTVQYQKRSSKNVPIFPVGLRVREEE